MIALQGYRTTIPNANTISSSVVSSSTPILSVKRSRETERVCKGLAAETFVKLFCGVGVICTNQAMLAKADFQPVIGTTKRNLNPTNPSALITTAGRVF